jgi:parallel beta-helix repeat protein
MSVPCHLPDESGQWQGKESFNLVGRTAIRRGLLQTNGDSAMKATHDMTMMGDRCRMTAARWAALVVATVLTLAGFGTSAAQAQTTRHVPAQHATIQAAIDASSDGDEIIVAPGTYYEAINFGGKAVHLRSSGGPAVTTIDATGLNRSVVRCISGEGPGTILEGFTITGGAGTVVGGSTCGGGMYNASSSPTVTKCVFTGNSSVFGGGMFNDSSSPTVTNCVFQNNSASRDGGAVYNFGAGSNSAFTSCIFENNTALLNGGGMFVASTSGATIGNCEFRGNSAGAGGGVWSASFDTTVADSLFCENTPDNIISRWTDLGGVEFRVTCEVAGAPPVAVCNAYPTDGEPISGSDITLECESLAGRMVTLDATGSYHPDGHALEYQWDLSDLDVVLDDPGSAIASGMFPIGVTMATLTVTDPFGAFTTCDVIVRVEDSVPPQVMVTTNAAVLWPPNHTMRAVQVIVTATDECFEPDFVFPIAVTVRSSEPDNASGNGDSDTIGDCHGEDGYAAPVNITSAFVWDEDMQAWEAIIYLRAERAGSGKGRSYTIDATAFDGSGNFGMSSCVIVVPKGMGGGGGN